MSVINCEGDELLLFHVSVRKNTAFCWGSKSKCSSKSIFWPTPPPVFFQINSLHLSFRSVVVITCASHAQGRRFEPGRKHWFPFSFHISRPAMRYSAGPRNVFQTWYALFSSVWRLFLSFHFRPLERPRVLAWFLHCKRFRISFSHRRLVGLGVWFSLRVREVPGSNPGRALSFFALQGFVKHFWVFSKKFHLFRCKN